jgi:N4-gp56 family major capsid protein
MAGDFSTYYPNHPWVGITKKERNWYDPELLSLWQTRNVYNQFITAQRSLTGVRAKTMTITRLLGLHPDYNELDLRQLWTPASHFNSEEIEITFSRYGGKVAYHRYDDMIAYWQQDGVAGIRRILNAGLGEHMIDVFDYLARNAFLNGSYKMYGGNATSIGDISTSDTATTGLIEDMQLGMRNREVPFSVDAAAGTGGNIICITTAGVLHDLQLQDDRQWLSTMQYADPKRLLNYEVGVWKNTRFIQTPRAMLANCGEVLVQKAILLPVNAGDGAGAKVDEAWTPGQGGQTAYLQLDSFDAGDFEVNDLVTIHTLRTNANGATNGVDFTDGKLHNRRVVAVDAATDRIVLDRPIMVDMTDDLVGNGVYGWVTKGRHIHTMVFIGGMDGVVLGVGRQPELHTPPPVDDFDSMYRFSWDAYVGYNVFQPQVFETAFVAGSYRFKGGRVIQ